jgi:hypothetical protein
MTARRDIAAITARIVERSKPGRERYLGRIAKLPTSSVNRAVLGLRQPRTWLCGLFPRPRRALAGDKVPNLGIITSYNDMLSAHQPFETYPALIKDAAREAAAWPRWRAAFPAMCDGVTQGQPGMELSLFSRDVIAMAAGVGLSHNMFDAARLSRRLRQDRARPGDRRPDLRPSAGSLHSGRTDDHGPAERREVQRPPALRRGQGRPRRAAWKPSRSPITAPAPAPSTAPRTPTRC